MGRRSLLSISESVDPFEVYVTNFSQDDINTMILDESGGDITSEAPIGTRTPEINTALTIDYTVGGATNTHAAIPLGQAYDELYIQYYAAVIKAGNASGYKQSIDIGNGVDTNNIRIWANHNNSNNTFRYFYGMPLVNTNVVTSSNAQWRKVGLHIDKVGLTIDIYIDEKLVTTRAIPNQDISHITLGGKGDTNIGYKLQFASLTVNTDHFQDIITNSNGVGKYTEHFVDYSMETNTNYNGVDLTAIDKSNWTGLHSEPFDPDGGTNYIDGAASYMYDIGSGNNYASKGDKFLYKRGVTHKMETLGKPHRVYISGSDSTVDNFNTIDSYGSILDPMPIVETSIQANPNDWVVYDAPNGIYRIALTSVANATGAWEDDTGLALRQVFDINWLTNDSGAWFKDSTYFYVRLWDDSNPALKGISIGSDQRLSMRSFGQIRNVHFRHAGINASKTMLVEFCKFSKSSGGSVNDSVFRDNELFDLWSGIDYYTTETNSPAGQGYGGSGDGGGISISGTSLVYRNTIDDAYLAVSIFSDAHGSILAYNLFKNTKVNTISILNGGSAYDVNNPIIIANNTVFASPNHELNGADYSITRDQPGHAFVHQNGLGANFMFFNNLMLLHYNQNSVTAASVMNTMSFTTQAAENSRARIGYNKYYKTPNSTSPAVIFNLGAGDNITNWGIALDNQLGDFKDLDDISNADATSTVTNVLPVLQADQTNTSGKWLTTNPIPVTIGGGYNYSYPAEITHDLSGNLITSTKNIGAY